MDFTKQELDLLFAAVGLWEQQCDCDPMKHMQRILSRSMDRSELVEKIEEVQQAVTDEHELSLRMRAERGCLIRAKLLKMRDSLVAEDFVKKYSKETEAK